MVTCLRHRYDHLAVLGCDGAWVIPFDVSSWPGYESEKLSTRNIDHACQ
jgi:hypothetical protein